MNQQFDPYDLYSGFEDDEFKGQGMWYDDNYLRVVSEMFQRNKRRIQYTGNIIWDLSSDFWLIINNKKKHMWVDHMQTGIISDYQTGTPLIYGTKKYQYGESLWGNIKPQANIPQENSRHINHMSVINTKISLDYIDKNFIKKDKYTYVNANTSRFEEDNFSKQTLIFVAKLMQKNNGYSIQIQSLWRISNTNTMDVYSSIGNVSHVMNDINNGKGRIYMYG